MKPKLQKALIKPYDEMDWVWISDHYDIHLDGLCRHDGELSRFKTDFDSEICTIYTLTNWEKIKWLWRKRMFEVCIGYHWTYPHRKQGVRFNYKKPRWFWDIIFKLYYKIKKKEE